MAQQTQHPEADTNRKNVERVLVPEAIAFVEALHRKFNPARQALLARRKQRQADLDAGTRSDRLPETKAVRKGTWSVAPVPADLNDHRVEITGPVDQTMMSTHSTLGREGLHSPLQGLAEPELGERRLRIGQPYRHRALCPSSRSQGARQALRTRL